MQRKFLASAATACLIKFTADPDHLSVNTGELVNTFLLTWRLLYLKWTPHRSCQLAPEKLLFSELQWNSRQGEYLFRSNWAYLLGDLIEEFFPSVWGVFITGSYGKNCISLEAHGPQEIPSVGILVINTGSTYLLQWDYLLKPQLAISLVLIQKD